MKHHKYVIVGGGMTADSAVRGIREIDKSGAIAIISDEKHPPYDRPPLSKSLWKGKPLESIWRHSNDTGVALHLGMRVVAIDIAGKKVTDASGNTYTYEKLLLATGGAPRRLPFGGDDIIYFRTLDDYQRLRKLCEVGSDFVVIGGGFIGSEVAAALAMNGKRVTMVFPDTSIGARFYPKALSSFINSYYEEHGVKLLVGDTVTAVRKNGTKITVTSGSGREIVADGVVAGLGIEPNVALAQSAGLEVSNGIVVDDFLRTRNADIYAAGDVANFYSPICGLRLRLEHEDNANIMGETAGRNMAGQPEAYHYMPFFYSDLFDLGYEAVGQLDSNLETVEDWKKPFRKGVVYYLKDGQVRGVLLWNTWDQVHDATQLIAAKEKLRPNDLIGRITE
jgi:3-phenylpropionate/trans-cinnamate dioxygenase ferredoxin reductase component